MPFEKSNRLALHGGTPVRDTFLDFSKPVLGDDEKREVMEVLDSGWLTSGKKASAFENEFASYIGVKHAVSVNSCTAGLFLVLKILGVGPGDEIITSPNTFPATANVIEHLGARPVFCDIRMSDGNIDPEKIVHKITPRTRGIIPVHYAGAPCDMGVIEAICHHHGIFILSDAAHAVETEWVDGKIGRHGIASAYSFYATKNLTTGEGGMVVTDDWKLFEQLKILRLHGLTDDAASRYQKNGKNTYDLVAPGYKFNMPDILAALGLAQLKKIDNYHKIRTELAQHYRGLIACIDGVKALDEIKKGVHANHLFPILVDFDYLTCSKEEFLEALKAENIGASQHFKPLHLYKFYKEKYGYRRGDYPEAENFGDRVISLPFSQYINRNDIIDVLTALEKIIRNYTPKRAIFPIEVVLQT